MHRTRSTTRTALLTGSSATFFLISSCTSTPAPAAPQDFCILSVEETGGTFAILDPAGNILTRIAIGERPHELEVSPDHRTAYVSQFGIADYDNRIGTPGTRIAEIDLTTGQLIGEFRLPPDVSGPHGVKLRPPRHGELFTNAEVGGDTMLVFDTATHDLLRRFVLPEATHNFIFSVDGSSMYSLAGPKGTTKLDAGDGHVLATADIGTPVRGLILSQAGTLLASGKGEVVEMNATDLSVIRRYPSPVDGQFLYLDQMPDGAIIAPSLSNGGIVIYPADGSTPVLAPTGHTPVAAHPGPDGLIYVANVEDTYISALNPDGTLVRTLTGLQRPNGLGFGTCPTSIVH